MQPLIFESVWRELEAEYGRSNLRFPKEIILLAGDREVVSLLLRELLKPEYHHGAIIDGFPRTNVQVECLKQLVDKMNELRREFYNSPLSIHFRHPTVHIMVLFVDESESIARQLKRGRETLIHNEILARKRYETFREQTWHALQSLKEIFHYPFISAQGSFEAVEQNILKELRYQSTLELDPRTVDKLRSIPVASAIIVHARQELVKRLDSYALEHEELFTKILGMIEKKMMPIIIRHAISGLALINTEDPILDDPLAPAILIDVFSERGYHAAVDIHKIDFPESVDLKTGEIHSRMKKVYRVQIRF